MTFLSRPFVASAARVVLLTSAAMGPAFLPVQATAAPGVFWSSSYERPDLHYYDMPPPRRVTRPPVLPKDAAKQEKVAAEGKKPIGPLVIAISIQNQNVKVYDSNGLFAQSPISSGMPGHSTPMGVFSVIQKNKHHRSNIYSGAPMPYMQRITWSGVAMHAGILPGYPASHGCIRMPMSFAMKMWGWTRMGARVIIAPGEVSPADFAHPALAALTPPATAPVAEMPVAANVKTADARLAGSAKVMTDAATSIGAAPVYSGDVSEVAAIVSAEAVSTVFPDAASDNDGLPPMPMPALVDFSDVTPDGGNTASLAAQAPGETSSSIAEMRSPIHVETPAEVSVSAPEPVTGPSAAPGAEPSAAPVVAAPLIKRNLPVAIFVSRKDAKLYVRQNFKPVLDMPIEIAPGEKALGTHVFTARMGTEEDKSLHWSVVSLPATVRQATQIREPRGAKLTRPQTVEVAQIAPSTADEALARIAIPSDLMARLGEALPAGSSLVVSDQGITQGETGDGTDFIVRLR